MKYEVILHEEAGAELEAAYERIAKEAPLNAARWYNRMLDRIETLGEFPLHCAVARESQYSDEEFRHLIEGNYRVIFSVRGEEVHVLHVRHGARKAIGEE